MTIDLEAIAAERARIRNDYLREAPERPPSSARGLHHFALLCADVRRTIEFYQNVLVFPLTEIFENRDYPGSNHFFFDIGNGNLLAFFDLPGLHLGPYAEVLGGLHHVAISVSPTAPGSNYWPTPWAKCTAPRSCDAARSRTPCGTAPPTCSPP